jgi:hypothetical protein
MQMRGFNTYMVKHALLHTAPAATQLQKLQFLTHVEGAHHINVEALVQPLSQYPYCKLTHPIGAGVAVDMTAQPSSHLAMFAVQACISRLSSLTCLEVSDIRTPLESPTLEDIFASLPALQSVCLTFRTNDPACATDFDSDDDEGNQQQERKQPNDFPDSLLRCFLFQCSSRVAVLRQAVYMHTCHSLHTVAHICSNCQQWW